MDSFKGYSDQRAPGIDGFNSLFFKKIRQITGPLVCAAVYKIFEQSEMYKSVNCAAVKLMPKVKNPVTIIEFRPISCCFIIYKIISDLIATRLHVIMNHLIDNNQSTFVPRKIITDNIILSHELIKGYGRKWVYPRCK